MADTNIIKLGNTDLNFKVGSSDCKIYLGDVLLYPEDVPPTPFSGKYKFTLTDDSVVSGECDSSSALTTTETSAYTSTLKEAVIGDCVTSIGSSVFWGCSSLTSITIPNSVTSIGVNAFRYCSGLISVTIPNNVTSIDNYAFRYCSGLTSVTIEATTPPTLGANVFGSTSDCPIYVPCSSVDAYKAANNWSTYADRIQGIPPCGEPQSAKFYAEYSNGDTERVECNSSSELIKDETQPMFSPYYLMTSAEIGDCVTTIGANAFQGCGALSSITISSSVTSIGSAACYSCYALSSVTIPDGVTSIGYVAFQYCSGLTDVTIGSGVTSIGVLGFQSCTNLSSLTIPDSVTTIGQQAFEGCFALSSVTIGSGVTSIGGGAFGSCSALTSVTINATTPPTLVSSPFYDTNNCPIYVPCESVNAYKAATNWEYLADRIDCVSPPTQKNYFRFVSKGTGTFTFFDNGSDSANTLSYSLDSGQTWTSLANGSSSPSLTNGETIMWKGSGLTIVNNKGIGTFSSNVTFDVEGNIMSLLYGDDFENEKSLLGKDYAFMNLFSGCSNVISAENLILPATTLSTMCYCNMFNRTIKLVRMPKLTAATTLAVGCYQNMYYNNPNNTVIETPESYLLPAEDLVENCYAQMFYGCASNGFNKITCLAVNGIGSNNSTNQWMRRANASGTFTKAASASWTTNYDGTNGWTVINAT